MSHSTTKLTVTFDEPVSAAADFKAYLDGTEIAATALTPVAQTPLGKYVYDVALATGGEQTKAATTGTHTLDLYYVQDAANNVTLKTSASYVIGNDTTAPEVKNLGEAKATTFKIFTSEPFKALNNADVVIKKGNYTFTAGTDYNVGAYNAADSSYTVTFTQTATDNTTNPLYATNETKVDLDVTVSNIIDNAGLTGKNFAGKVTLVQDTTAPVLVNTLSNYVDTDGLYVKFDENIVIENASKVIVRNEEGVKLAVPTSVTAVQGRGDVSTTTYAKLAYTSLPASSKYTIEFAPGAIKDASGNLNTTTLTATVNSKTIDSETLAIAYEGTPASIGNGKLVVDKNVITIDYGKDMDTSAINLANYKLNDAAFPTGTTIHWGTDKETVEITLPNNYFAQDTTGIVTITSGVKTLAGKAIYQNATTKTENIIKLGAKDIKDNIAPTLTKATYVLANDTDVTSNKLRLTFSEAVALNSTSPDFSDEFVIKVGDKYVSVTGAVAVSGKPNQIDVTLNDAINVSQAAVVTVVTSATQNPSRDITDASDLKNPLAAGSVTATK